MTCINALVRSNCVHVMTDGAISLPDGTITGTVQKSYILAQAHAVVAVRGLANFATCLTSYLNVASLSSFDDLLTKMPAAVQFTIDNGMSVFDPAVVAEVAKVIDHSRADVVVAGWSHARGRGEIHKIDTSRKGWRLEAQGDGCMMPGENPALLRRLEAAGWNLAVEENDETALLELIEHQRAVDDILPNGARFPTVGGFAQLTTITPDAISTRILRRWTAQAAA